MSIADRRGADPCRVSALVLLGVLAFDTAAQGLDEAQMRLLMEQAQQLQGCVAELDQATLESLRREGEALMQEVDALCQAGQREQAQARALAFGKRVEASAEMQQMRDCAGRMNSLLPMILPSAEALAENGSICDIR